MAESNVLKAHITLSIEDYTKLCEEVTQMETKVEVIKNACTYMDDKHLASVVRAMFEK